MIIFDTVYGSLILSSLLSILLVLLTVMSTCHIAIGNLYYLCRQGIKQSIGATYRKVNSIFAIDYTVVE